MENPLVSVVIPSYNHSLFILDRIRSVEEQNYDNMEIIFVDDASSDNTLKLVETYCWKRPHKIVKAKRNSGMPFAQWKRGCDLAAGDLIWIAESDDLVINRFLSILVPIIAEPDIDLVFCDSIKIGPDYTYKNLLEEEGGALRKDSFGISKILGRSYIFEKLAMGNVIENVSGVIFRKDLLMRHIGRIANYRYMGDWLLYIDIANRGTLCHVSSPMNYFRQHAATTRSAKRSDKDLAKFCDEYDSVQERLAELKVFDKAAARAKSLELRNRIGRVARATSNNVLLRIEKDYFSSGCGRIVLWGMGQIGRTVFSHMSSVVPPYKVVAIDKNPTWVSSLSNEPVISPDNYFLSEFKLDDFLLICTLDYESQIISILGSKKNRLTIKRLSDYVY